jgi:hypothetical protein
MRKRVSAGLAEAGLVVGARSTGIPKADMIYFVQAEYFLFQDKHIISEGMSK